MKVRFQGDATSARNALRLARRGQRGLTLIETAAALGIVALMLASFGRLTAENQTATKSRATAIQTQQITNAAAQYVQANFSKILAATNEGNTTVYVPVGRDAGDPASVNPEGSPIPTGGNLESMQKQGFVSQAYRDRNPFNQRTVLALSQPKVSGVATGRLEGIVMTYDGQEIPDSELGRIATSIGASGGYVPKNPPTGIPENFVTGAYGGWRTATADWNVPGLGKKPEVGHIASTLAFQSGVGESDYLNRKWTGDPEDNTMRTNLRMGDNDISGAKNIQASATITGGKIIGNTGVETTQLTALNNPVGGMVIDMNEKSASNVKTITGVVQDIIGRPGQQAQMVNFGDSVQVAGALLAAGGIAAQGDIKTTGDISTDGGVVRAKRFVDSDNTNYSIKPSQVSMFDTLDPKLINADTYIYGGSVSRQPTYPNGTAIPDPKNHAPCAVTDTACLSDLQQNIDDWYAAVAQMQTDPTRTMRLGDFLPTMVARGVFVVGSDGLVTDGQPDASGAKQPHLIDWRDDNGNPISVPTNVTMQVDNTDDPANPITLKAGVILPPSCGPNGKPEVYLSRLEDSFSFRLDKDPDTGQNVINVQGSAGGTIDSASHTINGDGIVSKGWTTDASRTNYQEVQAITTSPAVRSVTLGKGVSLSAEAYVAPVRLAPSPTYPEGQVVQWNVGVSPVGQRNYDSDPLNLATPGTGSSRTVVRRVLAQTFCNYNKARGVYAYSSSVQAPAPPK